MHCNISHPKNNPPRSLSMYCSILLLLLAIKLLRDQLPSFLLPCPPHSTDDALAEITNDLHSLTQWSFLCSTLPFCISNIDIMYYTFLGAFPVDLWNNSCLITLPSSPATFLGAFLLILPHLSASKTPSFPSLATRILHCLHLLLR